MFILARVIGCFILMPFFSERSVSQMIKLMFAFWLSIILFISIPKTVLIPEHYLELIIAFVNEFMLGLFIGLIARLIFYGIQFAGGLMDMQMGLSVAAAFDPATGSQETIISRLLYITSIAVFLMIDGHHLVLTGLFESFNAIPLFSEVAYPMGLQQLGDLGSNMFFIAVTISMPIIIIIFMLDFSLGLLARLAPQVNVFFLGFQIKPMLGAFILLLLIPTMMSKIVVIMDDLAVQIVYFYKSVKIL
ncbi:MAG: flagellar biosynthetic protein FliR [Candidatus Margulisbacteria bacterium]|nr:flagellar biosynthetic protein FliR [Candidatus Margulisiibacteriota bacterium]